MGTTGRPPVPQGLYNECRWEYLRDIYDKVNKHGIPTELVLNVDQTELVLNVDLLGNPQWLRGERNQSPLKA